MASEMSARRIYLWKYGKYMANILITLGQLIRSALIIAYHGFIFHKRRTSGITAQTNSCS